MQHSFSPLPAPSGGAVPVDIVVCHARDVGEFMRSLRVAGYRLDDRAVASELLRSGRIRVEDAFGQPVELHLDTLAPVGRAMADAAAASL